MGIHEDIRNVLTQIREETPDGIKKIIAEVCKSGGGFETCATPLRALLNQANKPETDRWSWGRASHSNSPEEL